MDRTQGIIECFIDPVFGIKHNKPPRAFCLLPVHGNVWRHGSAIGATTISLYPEFAILLLKAENPSIADGHCNRIGRNRYATCRIADEEIAKLQAFRAELFSGGRRRKHHNS